MRKREVGWRGGVAGMGAATDRWTGKLPSTDNGTSNDEQYGVDTPRGAMLFFIPVGNKDPR